MAYDETKETNLKHLKALATKAHAEATAISAALATLSNASIKTVKVNGTALTATEGAVDVTITCEKQAAADSGYAATYLIKANGAQVGDKINVAKDWLLTGVEKNTVTTADKAEGGKFADDADFAVGDRYADLTFNVKAGGAETSTHLYVNLQEFVDIYDAGNGLSDTNGTWSVQINSSSANGLSVDANGVALGVATDSAAGAMSAADHAQMSADHTKLGNVSTEANKTTVTTEGSGAIEIDGVSKTVVAIASDAEVNEMLTEIYGA